MTFGHDNGDSVFLGRDFGRTQNYSDEVAAQIDREIRKIVDEAFVHAVDILTEKKDRLIAIAEELLKVSTLSGDEFRKMYHAVPVILEPVESIDPETGYDVV